MKKVKLDILSAEELKTLYEKGDFSPYSPEKIFNDSKWTYNALKSAPFFGEETLGIYLKIYEKLGEMKYSPALYELGLLYYNGEWWLKKDLKKSLAYHIKAAELGNADAMFELYVYYSTGTAVKKDLKIAVNWCTKAAELNQPRACYNLGGFYAMGNGVKKNTATSVHWYDKASKAGNGKASATLGVMYKMGDEIKADVKKAKEYFAQADAQGFDTDSFLSSFGIDR